MAFFTRSGGYRADRNSTLDRSNKSGPPLARTMRQKHGEQSTARPLSTAGFSACCSLAGCPSMPSPRYAKLTPPRAGTVLFLLILTDQGDPQKMGAAQHAERSNVYGALSCWALAEGSGPREAPNKRYGNGTATVWRARSIRARVRCSYDGDRRYLASGVQCFGRFRRSGQDCDRSVNRRPSVEGVFPSAVVAGPRLSPL
jgi:hypothetical protein